MAASWGPGSKAVAYLRLVRPANLVTAAADSLTGWVVAGGPGAALPWLVAASVCLYAGGVVFNDVFDYRLDVVERPERPLPRGTISPAAATVLGACLLLAGVAAAARVSRVAAAIALLIAGAVLFYDAVAKHNRLGPVVMGSCRALNLLLGLSAVPATLPHTGLLALLPLVYIAAITALSRGEVHGGSRGTSRLVLLLFGAVCAALLLLHPASAWHTLCVVPFVLLLAARVGPPLWRAYATPAAGPVRAAVGAGIVSLLVLDSAMAAGYGGVVVAAAILSLLVVATELGKLFPVT